MSSDTEQAGGGSHVFSEIFLHVTWHCKDDRPLIHARIEPVLHRFIEEYCRKMKGVHYLGVGGTEDHVHLVAQVEPFVLVSEFIRKIKGASSHELNKEFGRGALEWQRGYGVVSFAKRHLPGVLKYVREQKEHHRKGSVRDVLEQFTQRGVSSKPR